MRAGFTLIEMIVAIILLAVGVVSTMICIAAATRSTGVANEYTSAALLAQQRFAELEASPDQLVAGEQQGEFGQDHPGFTWDQNIEIGAITQVLKVTMTIRWRAGGTVRSAQFVSYELVPQTSGTG
jgi:prepilin-type N-terminal cleavage/methylation domain-containing protein